MFSLRTLLFCTFIVFVTAQYSIQETAQNTVTIQTVQNIAVGVTAQLSASCNGNTRPTKVSWVHSSPVYKKYKFDLHTYKLTDNSPFTEQDKGSPATNFYWLARATDSNVWVGTITVTLTCGSNTYNRVLTSNVHQPILDEQTPIIRRLGVTIGRYGSEERVLYGEDQQNNAGISITLGYSVPPMFPNGYIFTLQLIECNSITVKQNGDVYESKWRKQWTLDGQVPQTAVQFSTGQPIKWADSPNDIVEKTNLYTGLHDKFNLFWFYYPFGPDTNPVPLRSLYWELNGGALRQGDQIRIAELQNQEETFTESPIGYPDYPSWSSVLPLGNPGIQNTGKQAEVTIVSENPLTITITQHLKPPTQPQSRKGKRKEKKAQQELGARRPAQQPQQPQQQQAQQTDQPSKKRKL